jgi:hypothetical protein
MTIERQWLEIFKSEVPEAFSDEAPFACEVGFIDAQIKLMAMPHDHEWDAFLLKQFRRPVESMFALGARTVVLAFDDYENVPRAKAITQAKRRKDLAPYEFSAGDAMPERPPNPWNAAMANRAFKADVVAWVVDQLAFSFRDLPSGLEVVIDWRGPTQTRLRGDDAQLEPRQQIGEADLKFLHWAKTCGAPMAAEAIDGDFVPIALASGWEPSACGYTLHPDFSHVSLLWRISLPLSLSAASLSSSAAAICLDSSHSCCLFNCLRFNKRS